MSIGVEHGKIMKKALGTFSVEKKIKFIWSTNAYQSCTEGRGKLELLITLRNKTRNYICLYVVQRYKDVFLVVILKDDYHASFKIFEESYCFTPI